MLLVLNILEFWYRLILPGQIMWNTWQGKLTKGLAYLGALSIYYRLGRASFSIKASSCPLFEYADLVWGDKHNATLTSSLEVLQNKAAKIILDRPLYSSASHALATLK